MLKINHYNEGSCYSNNFRDLIVFNFSQNIYEIIFSTDKFRLAEQILKEFSNNGSYHKIFELEFDIIGNMKIICAIENYFKLILLKNNFLIHKLKKEICPAELVKKQLKEPMLFEEVLKIEKQNKPTTNLEFSSLLNQTLTITNFLNSKKIYIINTFY